MKSLLLGIVLIVVVGVGGLVYRNAVDYTNRPITCPQNTRTCPDGTVVSRTGNSCTSFPECPPPNVSLPEANIIFAVPEGFAPTAPPDATSIAAYRMPGPTPLEPADIIIRRYAVATSSTAFETIRATAIGGASGLPVPATLFSSVVLGPHSFTVVSIERFEAVIATAYYLTRGNDVLRFDAIDRGVVGWMEPNLDITTLPANAALRALLTTLQGK